MPAVGLPGVLVTRILGDRTVAAIVLQGGGSAYLRFAVRPDQEALVQVTGASGAALVPGMRLTVVRIK